MGTFRETGTNPDRKEDIVKHQTELPLTVDEELRRSGRKGWTRKGMGFWAAWGCTLSEGGEQVPAELLSPGRHWLCPAIHQLQGAARFCTLALHQSYLGCLLRDSQPWPLLQTYSLRIGQEPNSACKQHFPGGPYTPQTQLQREIFHCEG